MILKSSIDNLNEIADIVEIVNSYVELKKSGTNYKAPCPFHSEKTGSFVVSPQKQIYHCFGCGAGGKAIRFVQDIENISYVQAIENVAERYAFQLEYQKGTFKKTEKLPILEIINDWFIENLKKNREAFNYLKNRGISETSIQKFKLGYAPSSYEFLDFLLQSNISNEDGVEIGVLAVNDDGRGYYSRFHERIIFPIFGESGKIIAFGGQTLGNHPAKYINSPSTPYFNKSRILYGYNFAKKSIYQEKKIIVVEGYLDLIMLHQSGFRNVVAPLGTALTKEQSLILKKSDSKINLAFDGDKAGISASIRALDILIPDGIEASISKFGENKDPADLVKNGDIEKLGTIFESSEDGVKFYISNILEKIDIENPYEKDRAGDDIQSLLNRLPTNILRDSYSKYANSVFKGLYFSNSLKVNHNSDYGKISESSGFSELMIIRAVIENRSLFEIVKSFINERNFYYHREALKDILNGFWDSDKLRGISVLEMPVLDLEKLKKELLNVRILDLEKRERAILESDMKFLEKSEALRKASNILVKFKKKRASL